MINPVNPVQGSQGGKKTLLDYLDMGLSGAKTLGGLAGSFFTPAPTDKSKEMEYVLKRILMNK